MQITGAGPAQQTQFDFDTKIEKQGSDEAESRTQVAAEQSVPGSEAREQTASVQASSESSENNTEDRSGNRERGVGERVDISV
ncbi:hypothetical protein [Breoghania sp.]|uniref:hypothetical protein n=1 Tax=Breoghania sp. TaxID=2065378 RepID=UPI002627F6CE|nr:hypothetical protein [Breoghania sp.]MDJ0930619.1 hypothetical protein [Breoghania sp.]